MADINEVKFSGVIERLKEVQTKTGTPMATWLLKVGRDRFKCIAFHNIAEAMLQCADGDNINIAGSGSINSWKDNNEIWRNDFQLTAWSLQVDGEPLIQFKKNSQPGEAALQQPQPEKKVNQDNNSSLDKYDYQGGPF